MDRLAASRLPDHRGLAAASAALPIAVFGWTPAGVSQSWPKGHNDIAMVALALLWLLQLMRGRRRGADRARCVGLLQVRDRAAVPDRYHPRHAVPKLTVAQLCRCGWPLPASRPGTILAVFYRSPQFFDGIRLVSTWYFLRPARCRTGGRADAGPARWTVGLAAPAVFPALPFTPSGPPGENRRSSG